MRAVELLEELPPSTELASAYRAASFFAFGENELDDALAWIEKAVSVARDCGNDEMISTALALRGFVRCDLGDIGGLEDLRRSIELSERAGDAFGRVLAYNNMADRIWLIEGPGAGLELSQKAQAVGRATGYVYDTLWSQLGALFMLFERGDWDRTLKEADELITWGRPQGAGLIASCAALFKAHVLFRRGDLRGALDLEEYFLPILREAGDLEALAPCLALAAIIHADSGDEAGALALIEEFLVKTEPAIQHRARFLPDVMRAATSIRDNEFAPQLLLQEDDVRYPRERHAVVTGQAIVAENGGRFEEALTLHTDAAQRWAGFGFMLEEGQALLGAGRCLMALGRNSDASPVLHEAAKIFVRLGAKPLINKTDEHLEEATALSS
jgi:tetratricopeptide (TPR) repeat protein